MSDPNTEHFLHSDLFHVLKLTSDEKKLKLNGPELQGEWRVFNIYPQTGSPMDESERYFLYPDYVHEFDDDEDSDEVNINCEAIDRIQYNILSV